MFNFIFNTIFVLWIMTILLGCKANLDTNPEAKDSYSRVSFQVFCSKMIKIKLNDSQSKVINVQEGKKSDTLDTNEFLGMLTYRQEEYSDGSLSIECSIDDGSRQYNGKSTVASRNAYLSDGLCTIGYDLDEPTFGFFYMYWNNSNRGAGYLDEDSGFQKEFFVRGSECSSF